MANLVVPTNVQKTEFDVTTAEGPSRVTIVTGKLTVNITSSIGNVVSNSFKALVDPILTPGQFRKATATVSLSAILFQSPTPPPLQPPVPDSAVWRIDDAQATLDDEAGQVQLVVDISVRGAGTAQIFTLWFQVTTLAKV